MRFDIATLFPEMCETVVNSSIIGRGIKAGKLEVHCHQIRDYTTFLDLAIGADFWKTPFSFYF